MVVSQNRRKDVAQRTYVSQQEVPSVSLERALRVAMGIADNFAFRPASPLQVAGAIGMQPTSGTFRMLTGASIAYGLTSGGYNADQIALTSLGLRIVRPTSEGDDLTGRREALLKPRVIREFLQKYDRAPIPRDEIAKNVLLEMGVPLERASAVYELILEGAGSVGFVQEIRGRKYIEITATINANEPTEPKEDGDAGQLDPRPNSYGISPEGSAKSLNASISSAVDTRSRRVFLTHGKNRALIEPIKKLLAFGELEAVVSVQTHTVSQRVPGKVMEEMRSCGAAIIHVEDERTLIDSEGTKHIVLNDNVLIEIGAAMALYGQRFILVVKEGVSLPSNLQGLLQLRYKGETLDMEETVKLLEAVNDLKKRSLPTAS